MRSYDPGLFSIDVRPAVFHYGAVVFFDEIYAIVAEISSVQVGIFELVYFQIA
jgi:hypothetical protein